ncbi:hypothetical protein ZIOFF_075413 [Zingiber officinale]|uniref:Uncharacterized protein n=1 Tax=Zingiber officinale TaxID=94328 RepID=A0A8J5ESM8_ZINOF|nr:hypothetical protein ZIOFF_075413 [Zingiber officinale]
MADRPPKILQVNCRHLVEDHLAKAGIMIRTPSKIDPYLHPLYGLRMIVHSAPGGLTSSNLRILPREGANRELFPPPAPPGPDRLAFHDVEDVAGISGTWFGTAFTWDLGQTRPDGGTHAGSGGWSFVLQSLMHLHGAAHRLAKNIPSIKVGSMSSTHLLASVPFGIKKLDPTTRKVTTLAGTGNAGFKDGPPQLAQCLFPPSSHSLFVIFFKASRVAIFKVIAHHVVNAYDFGKIPLRKTLPTQVFIEWRWAVEISSGWSRQRKSFHKPSLSNQGCVGTSIFVMAKQYSVASLPLLLVLQKIAIVEWTKKLAVRCLIPSLASYVFDSKPRIICWLSEPSGIVETGQGKLLIADTNNNFIRYIDLNEKDPVVHALELRGVQPPSSKSKLPKRLRRRLSADTDIIKIDGGTSTEGIFNLSVLVPEGYHFSKEARSKFDVETDPTNAINIEPVNGNLSPEGSASLKFRRNSPSAVMGRIYCKIYYCKEDEVCLYQSVAFDVSFREELESTPQVVKISYTVTPKSRSGSSPMILSK